MKQIKVEITPREWAEKRFEFVKEWTNQPILGDMAIQLADEFILLCGFVLKEDAEQQPKKPITMDDLKEGMIVMLRSDLLDGVDYGYMDWDEDMKKGCEVTIKEIQKSCFYIIGDTMIYSYTPEMIDYIIQ